MSYRKRYKIETYFQWKTNRKSYVAYRMTPVLVTLNELEGLSPIAGLFKCNPSNICAVFYQISTDSVLARSLSDSWASCCYILYNYLDKFVFYFVTFIQQHWNKKFSPHLVLEKRPLNDCVCVSVPHFVCRMWYSVVRLYKQHCVCAWWLQPAKVTAHWHKGTAFVIKFDESVIARDKLIEGR